METMIRSGSCVRFDGFELDLLSRELYCNGARLKVRGHPVDILAILLEHPGELVTRETIRARLWPENTFVDFDHSLNIAMMKLREVLRDRAESPRFIETLPKLGYRFIAPVERPTPASDRPSPQEVITTDTSAAPSKPPSGSTSALRRAPLLILIGFAAVVAIGSGAFYMGHRSHTPSASAVHRIAVLPLWNASRDPAQEYFADGMTDQLITELAHFKNWEVISRTSAMRYKNTEKSLREIAHELGADRIIEGMVLRSGSRVRITAQLVDATRDTDLWSGSFEGDLADVLALQREVARTIARQADLALSSEETAYLASARKVVPHAFDAFLAGRALYERERYVQAVGYFQIAIAADPNFALAHAFLAEADGMESFIHDLPFSDRFLNASRTAMSLDPGLAEAHLSAGDEKFYGEWDWVAGESEYRRAMELDPHSELALLHYGGCLSVLRRWDAAIATFQDALRVDPFAPQLHRNLLFTLVNAHRYDQAIVQFHKTMEIDPNSASAYYIIGSAYEQMKRLPEAAAAYLKGDALSGLSTGELSVLQHAYETAGLHGYWAQRLAQFPKESRNTQVSKVQLAFLYTRVGANDQAIQTLEEAYRAHSVRMPWINASIIWEPLRPDPRFQALIRQLKFPPD